MDYFPRGLFLTHISFLMVWDQWSCDGVGKDTFWKLGFPSTCVPHTPTHTNFIRPPHTNIVYTQYAHAYIVHAHAVHTHIMHTHKNTQHMYIVHIHTCRHGTQTYAHSSLIWKSTSSAIPFCSIYFTIFLSCNPHPLSSGLLCGSLNVEILQEREFLKNPPSVLSDRAVSGGKWWKGREKKRNIGRGEKKRSARRKRGGQERMRKEEEIEKGQR